ncbi:MAG TPA: HD domain-containing phosphohydrolase, partial [Candidatus Omnitrophota bacterium]|nr:HD domain-containing phosphohydrolase [Candidatus Omnitrophota bacterium]
ERPLSYEEILLIRQHSLRSLDIVKDFPFLIPAGRAVLYHHERYDGAGYPEGLKGPDIPLVSSMISLAETYESLINPRPFRRQPATKKEALEIIRSEAGKQLDPAMVGHFLKANPV